MKKICSALLAAALAVGTIFSPGAAAQDPGWSPDAISGLKAWYDAAELQLEDGEKVDAWANQAGNAGYDAAQPDASKQPVFQAAGKINGKPGVKFQQNTNLKLAESFSLDDFTIFAVVNPDEMVNAGDANQIFSKLGLYGDHNWYFNIENGGFNFGWKDDGGYRNYTGANRAMQVDTNYILGGVKDGAGGTQYMNGAAIGKLPGSGNPVKNDQPNFIGGGSGPATSMVGVISEILVYDRGLNEDEAAAVQAYLSDKWGIAIEKPIEQPEGTVYIDGEPFQMFRASNPSYKQVLAPGTDTPPVVTADFSASGVTATVEQADSLPGTAKIRLEKDGAFSEYTIEFSVFDKETLDMQQPEIEQVKVTGGFWKEKLDTIADVTVETVLENLEKAGTVDNFKRAGVPGQTDKAQTLPWNDGLLFESIRGAADFLRAKPNAEIEKRIDGYIDIIYDASLRSDTGYLSTWMMMDFPGLYFDESGDARQYHDAYNFGCMTEAAVHYYKATGKTKLLFVATRFAEFIADNYGYGKKADGTQKINMVPSHEGPEEMLLKLYTLYRDNPELKAEIEGYNPDYPMSIDENEYANLVKFWIENRGNYENRVGNTSYGVYAQDHALYYDQTTAAGHAVRANLFYTGMAAAGREFGDYTYLAAADHLWNNIVDKQMYITGGVGAVGMDEAYGENYHLPNDGYCETCAQVAMGFFSEYLSLSFGEAKYADVVENYIYNGVLGGMGLDGDSFFYQQPLSAKEGRWDWINYTPCCPPMFLKFYSEMPTYIYSYTDQAVYVNQFVSSELTLPDGRKIAMDSGLPFGGDSSITVTGDTKLHIRIPQWVGEGNETIRVNGQAASYDVEKGYAVLEVRDGDKVEVSFPMEARRIYNDEQVTFTEGMVAFGYGPLVYCFENTDNPAIPGFSTGEFCMGVAPDAELTTQFEPDLLGGVTTISAPASYYDFDGNLQTTTAKAIPFYARMNRGVSPSFVFIGEEPRAAASRPKNWLAKASSSRNLGNSPAAAFDGNPDTYWAAGSQEMPQILLVDLGSEQAFDRVKLTFTSGQAWKYQILYSNDAKTWEMFADRSQNSDSEQAFEETGRASGRYVAVRFTESAGVGYISVAEMAVFGTGTQDNLALNGLCGATSYSNPVDSPFAMLDGNETTRYCPPGEEKPQAVTMDMGSVVDITGMRILFEKPTQWTYTIEVSEDGNDWNTYQAETYNMTQDKAWREIEKAGRGRYVRLSITGTTDGVWASVWEFDVQTTTEPESIFEGLLEGQEPVPSVKLDRETLTLKEGERTKLTATVTPAGDKVSFASSDTDVATVDADGNVTAVKAGTAVITAETSSGAKATCTVTVITGDTPPLEKGDLDKDGEVTIADVMEACKVMARESAGTDPTDDEIARGDLDGDGEITIADVMEVCKILARQG